VEEIMGKMAVFEQKPDGEVAIIHHHSCQNGGQNWNIDIFRLEYRHLPIGM
jgi:hypothetical protein